jgi:lysozyme
MQERGCMEVPGNAIELAMFFEGFYAKPYICPAGYWTIGYGHLCDKEHPEISKWKAEEYLAEDLQDALVGTLKMCPILVVNEDWLGAITDFTFNLGVGKLQRSTLRRKINSEQWDEVPNQLRRWVFGGGKKLRGLVLRREAESIYFN